MKRIAGIIFLILITAVVTSGMVVYHYLGSFSNKSGANTGSQIQPKGVKAGEPINVLLLGEDIGTVGNQGSPQRSDTMIVIHYDPATSEVAMVSIPRDTRVLIGETHEKINAANAIGGAELAIRSVEDLLKININYYVEVNYEGFKKLVDAIGGIDVVIPYNMNYDDPTQDLHIHFKKGQKVHLNGQKAEEYVRWRKNNDGTGYAEADLGRIQTQQEFMVKVIEKLKSPSTVFKLPYIAKILPDYIKTNMDPMTMLNYSKEVLKINPGFIQKFTLQGEAKMINGLSYFVYDPDASRDIISLLGSDVNQGPENIDNSDIRIQILNGSNINGAASKVRDILESKGYDVESIGNISGVDFTSSHIIDKTLKKGFADKVGTELNINDIEKDQDTLSRVDVVVVIGRDIEKIINNN